MEMIGNVKAYTLEECLDKHIGPIGTPERDKFEAKIQAELRRAEAREARQARRTARAEKMQKIISPIVNVLSNKKQVARV